MNDLERAVIEAAKAWAPTRFTRTNSGLKERLCQAVEALNEAEGRHAVRDGDRDYDLVALDGSGSVLRTHSRDECAGPVCCIHKPSDHHMVTWPQVWRSDQYLMVRVCKHDVGHPDPDDLSIRRKLPGADVHDCDGCCFGAYWAGERQ